MTRLLVDAVARVALNVVEVGGVFHGLEVLARLDVVFNQGD